jgi:ATP:corrinoid adenosyltransferase
MKLYTEAQVKDLLETQRGNCYVAILSFTKLPEVAEHASKAPLPGGEQFDQFYGIDPEALFKEDFEDRELQRNFESFQRARESAKTSYNATVPTLNSMVDKIVNLKELIVTLSVQGLPTEKVVKRLAKLDDSFTALAKKSDAYKQELDRQDTLIKNYKDWNERKLFMHWKYLTHFGVTSEDWLEWKKQFVDVMI